MQDYYHGDFEESARKEKKAKKWAICSIISGIILVVGIIITVCLVQVLLVVFVYGADSDSDNSKNYNY